MGISHVTEYDILARLRSLPAERWAEVLDFIGYLGQEAAKVDARRASRPVLPERTRVSAIEIKPQNDEDRWEAYLNIAAQIRQTWTAKHATQALLDEIRR